MTASAICIFVRIYVSIVNGSLSISAMPSRHSASPAYKSLLRPSKGVPKGLGQTLHAEKTVWPRMVKPTTVPSKKVPRGLARVALAPRRARTNALNPHAATPPAKH